MMGYELELVQQRNKDLQRQAQRERLLRFVKGQRRGPASRLLGWTGRQLVAVGLYLQSRQSPPAPAIMPAFERLP
ncbi:MAG: hypothetical protein DIU68_020070 [Chloroflexota bacterium]|nr:MAG: hypothetical protein DIU68_11695 [Chloroflexota bacterium]